MAALRELNLFVDIDKGTLVSGFNSSIPATLPRFVFGDSIPVSVRALTADTASGVSPYREVDLAGKSIRLGIGNLAGTPTAGTWTITKSGETTDPLGFNASASEVEDALNALESLAENGGVTVTSPGSGVYRIVFNEPGNRTYFTVDSSSLYPSTAAAVAVALDGNETTKEVVLIALESQPAAYVELTEELPESAIGVDVIQAGGVGVGEIQQISISPIPYGGTYSLKIGDDTTAAIAFDATAEEIQSALELITTLAGKVQVAGIFPIYTISFGASLGEVGEIEPNVAGLIVPSGRRGNLNTNTGGMIELLNGEATRNATLEIEIVDLDTSTAQTICQTTCVVAQDLIPSNPASSTPLPNYPDLPSVESMIASAVAESFLTPIRTLDVQEDDWNLYATDAGKVVILTNSDGDFDINVSGVDLAEISIGGTITIKNLTGDICTLDLEDGAIIQGSDSLDLMPNQSAQLIHLGEGGFLMI